MSDVEDLDDFDDFGEDGDDLDDFGDLELEEGEDFEGEAIDFDDNFDEPADAGPLEEEELGGAGGEDDAWRFDDTKLDDLEDFLKQVEQAESPKAAEEAKPAKTPSAAGNNILQLIRDVNNELADAQREVLQLRDQNTALREELGGAGGGDGVDEDTVLDLGDEAEKLYAATQKKSKQLLEAKKEYIELMLQACAIPESAKTAAGPAKRGMLSMGKKKLDCELIGGETLELSDRSQEGHCHVSKISLRFIKDVKVVENPKNSFGVTTQGGSYVMTTSSAAEAKSWVRAVDVSRKVAVARHEKMKNAKA